MHSSVAARDGSLRGARHRARIRATRWLAMTAGSSNLRHLVIAEIIGIARFLAAIEGFAVIGRQRESVAQTPRRVWIGNEDAPERESAVNVFNSAEIGTADGATGSAPPGWNEECETRPTCQSWRTITPPLA